MGFPVRTHTIQFLERPGEREIQESLGLLTGLELCYEYVKSMHDAPSGTEIWCKKLPKQTIFIDCISIQDFSCVRIWSETAQVNYLEISTIYVLGQLGGKIKGSISIPSWAGKSWDIVRPKSFIDIIKFHLNGKLPD